MHVYTDETLKPPRSKNIANLLFRVYYLIMWRYLAKVDPPNVVKDKLKKNETTEKTQKVYEKEKRKRTFQPHWRTGRQWLVDSDDGMICLWC